MTSLKKFPIKRKDKATNLPAKRKRPKGGWVTNPVRTTEHGRNGRIGILREMKRIEKEKAENERKPGTIS